MQYEDGVSQLSYYPKNVGFDSEQMVQTVLTRRQYFRHKFPEKDAKFPMETTTDSGNAVAQQTF